MINTTNIHEEIQFRLWGIAVKYYGFIGKIFKAKKYLDKSVYYMDKRWDMVMYTLTHEHKKGL